MYLLALCGAKNRGPKMKKRECEVVSPFCNKSSPFPKALYQDYINLVTKFTFPFAPPFLLQLLVE